MYRAAYFRPFLALNRPAKLSFALIAVRTMQVPLRGRRIGICPLSKDRFGKVRRMGDLREQRINVGVGRETPEVMLNPPGDSGDRSERGDRGCLAGITGRSVWI
jgi:hypothetical protein